MSNQDWERFGEEIRRSVQDAVDSQDFSRLNQTINDTVNSAADYFTQGVRNVGDIVNENIRVQKERNAYRGQNRSGLHGDQNADRRYQYQDHQYKYRYTQEQSPYQEPYGTDPVSGQARPGYEEGNSRKRQMPALYASAVPASAAGLTLSLTGGIIGGISAAVAVIMLCAAFAEGAFGSEIRIAIAVFVALAFGFGIMERAGAKIRGRVKRFRTYVRILGEREYCNIKELTEHVGKSKKFIVKDLEKMISKGWFRQGHLDTQKTCLMVSNDAYRQYMQLADQMEQKKQEEKAAKESEEAANAELSPEVREVIRAGDDFIRKIHKCNDAIPGEEISAKISRMEMLVERIFDRVEQNPESVSDLHRMMEYYLPTTVKLLEAYEELDAQPVQGENIISSKREIEKTLDTLNTAFEKLLDDLFQDTAWDLSSDISVLHTMLAQEGLTRGDFEKVKPE